MKDVIEVRISEDAENSLFFKEEELVDGNFMMRP